MSLIVKDVEYFQKKLFVEVLERFEMRVSEICRKIWKKFSNFEYLIVFTSSNKIYLVSALCSFLPPSSHFLMLLNRSTTPRDSATNIEKTSRKGVLERE